MGSSSAQEHTLLLLQHNSESAREESHLENDKVPYMVFPSMNRELYGFAVIGASAAGSLSETSILHYLSSPKQDILIPSMFLLWTASSFSLITCSIGVGRELSKGGNLMLNGEWKTIRKYVMFRGIMGALAYILGYKSFSMLDLGESTTIYLLAPTIAIILSCVVLREPISMIETIACIGSIVGVILVARPWDTVVSIEASTRRTGLAIGILGSTCAGFGQASLRYVASSVNAWIPVLYISLWTFFFTTLYVGFDIAMHVRAIVGTPTVAVLVGILCICSFYGHICMGHGLQHCRGFGLIIRNMDVPLSYWLGLLVFGEMPTAISSFGALLVLCATSSLAIPRAMESPVVDVGKTHNALKKPGPYFQD